MVCLSAETKHHLQVMSILECVVICSENVAGQIVVCPMALSEGILSSTSCISVELVRPDTVWNIDRSVAVISLNPSIGYVGCDIELFHRSDDHLGSVCEIEFLLVVLVLSHGENNLTAVGNVITGNERVGIQTCSVRVEQRERGRTMPEIDENILVVRSVGSDV